MPIRAAALAALLTSLAAALPAAQDPPSRALSLELCQTARLAGTSGSERAARVVARHLAAAGFAVELDRREVLLSLPRRLELALFAAAGEERALHRRVARFDPDAIPPGDVPLFNAWAKSARVRGPVVDVGRGLRADYERLAREGVSVAGCIALARYGGSYRGVKVELAVEFGALGVLLFSESSEDGAQAGAPWPAGPFKPHWSAQRGSIYPISHTPGDPSTPGFASPAPGATPLRAPLALEEIESHLPKIPCLPIGWGEAELILARLSGNGPGPLEALLDVEQPPERRAIVNVIGRLAGGGSALVLAGNHRDAWVRGAQDAGSGTVALLRAAQALGERARAGWRPDATIVLCFWDAEEPGLVGSTEWGEANAELLRASALAYVNVDAAVGGLRFRAAGTPGFTALLRRALGRVPAPDGPHGSGRTSVFEQWSGGAAEPDLELPGSGSDYTVFLHHLGIPILDVGFSGARGGQYHTAFDDFVVMDRFLDPGWRGHEAAGRVLFELLCELSDAGEGALDSAEAARALARLARAAGTEVDGEGRAWLGAERAERLASAFDELERAPALGTGFYRALEAPAGLAARPWFKNRLWAPGLETGYSAETFPELRAAARVGAGDLERELAALVAAVRGRATVAPVDLGAR